MLINNLLTLPQVSAEYGISRSFLYKLTMNKTIGFFKPSGKLIFFDRKDIENWIKSKRVSSMDEVSEKAQSYCQTNKN